MRYVGGVRCLLLPADCERRYETSSTKQPFLDGQARSGDGTLPYSSMAYAREWQKQPGANVDIIGTEWRRTEAELLLTMAQRWKELTIER